MDVTPGSDKCGHFACIQLGKGVADGIDLLAERGPSARRFGRMVYETYCPGSSIGCKDLTFNSSRT